MQVKELVKSYGKVRAVDGVSFTVERGTCFGILGPNGAGKTTTIEMMETILKPDSGTIFFDGLPVDRHFREQIGIQFQSTSLQEFLTVRETLELFSKLYVRRKPLEDIIRICDLSEFVGRDNRSLSGGQRQRMLLGIALVNDPDLLFLDEPTTGLDPQSRRNFWRLVENIRAEGKTIILTTHYMDEAESLCDRIIIMDHGRIIEEGTPDGLLRKHFGNAVLKLPEKVLAQTTGMECRMIPDGQGLVEVVCNDLTQTIHALLDRGISLEHLSIERKNLDDLFLKLTGNTLDA